MEAEPGRVPRMVAWLTVLAAVTYSSWVLGFLMRPGPDVVDGYVSEFSARDQHLFWIFAGGDLVTGVIMTGVAARALVTLSRRPWSVAGWGFLLLFGLWVIGDATILMDCAPSVDTACARREQAGTVSFAHEFHSVTSAAVVTCGIAAFLCLSVAGRRYGWWPALARWGWVLAVVEALAAVLTLGLMAAGRWFGVTQRVQIAVLCLGLSLIARALWQRPAPRAAVPAPRSAPDGLTPTARPGARL